MDRKASLLDATGGGTFQIEMSAKDFRSLAKLVRSAQRLAALPVDTLVGIEIAEAVSIEKAGDRRERRRKQDVEHRLALFALLLAAAIQMDAVLRFVVTALLGVS